ncbi:MAG: hypothetical protein II839_08440 [Kiritimatiellae bacterium]|nr:hypothetical protein [Kiritimatiellia bacterium]
MKRILPLLALLALPAAAANDGAAVYRPGLTQARIPLGSPMGYVTAYTGVPVLASNLLTTAEADWLDRTLDVFKDGEHANDATNSVSGKTWPWLIENRHGVFAYEGEMFVEQGKDYYFYGRFWTGEAMVVDGTTVVSQGPHNGYNYSPDIFGTWTAPKTGWVPFNAWEWTCEETFGPRWSQWGLQYNVEGFSLDGLSGPDTDSGIRKYAYNVDPHSDWRTNVWQRFADTGAGMFLRTVTGERFTTVGESSDAEGGRSFDLTFAGVPTNATLVAFSGPTDGLHATSEWASVSAVLAEIPPGDSTTNVTVALANDATVLRFRLAHFDAASTNGLDVFEEWTEMVAVSASPVVRVDSASPGYTNLVVAGNLASFGIGGSSGAVTIQVAAADDSGFGEPVAELELPPAFAVGAFEAEVFGLSTNTAYLVRATATNQLGAVGSSAPVAFSTRIPGPASVSVAPTVCALFSADLTATVSDWGGGSWDVADAWIDVSADDTFPDDVTQTLPLGALSGATPVSATATATGLEAAHDYFARVRAVNSWGVESVSDPVAFSTSDKPIGFPHEATVVAAKGRVSASLAPTFVTEGTVYNVTLRMEGIGGSLFWPNQTGYGPFAHTQYTPAGSEVVFVYTIAWTYGDLSGEITVHGRATAKLADRTIDSVPEIDPDYKVGDRHGAYLRPGDTVEIIQTPGTRIDWHTNAVLSVTPTNGVFVVEALEPGATLLYETDLATGATNNVTGVAIVLPAGSPAGGVYVHRALKDWSWSNPDEWEMVSPGPQGYPDAAGAWAIIASDALGPNDTEKKIDVTVPVTVGHLAVGQHGFIHHGVPKNLKSHWPWIFSDDLGLGGSIRFDTGDGSASGLRLLGHSYTTSRVLFQVPVSMANDLEIDELNRVQDTLAWQNTRFRGLWFMKPVDVETNELRTVRAHPYWYQFNAPNRPAGGVESGGWISFRNIVLGSGTIRLEAATHVGLVGADGAHVAPFTGTWIVANGDLDPHLNSAYGGAGLNTWGLSLGMSREMIIRGTWHRAEKTWPRGALVRTGFNNVRTAEDTGNGHTGHAWTNDWQDALPPKITLDGGDLQIQPQGPMNSAAQAVANATGIRRNLFRIDELVVPVGPMGRMDFRNRNNSTGYAHARTEITNLVLSPGAVASFALDDNQANVTHEVYLVNGPEAAWEPEGGAESQFLPFFFANNQFESTGGNTPGDIQVSDPGKITLAFRDTGTGKVTLKEPETSGNGYRRWTAADSLADGAKYFSMQLAANVTNSFAPGATVTNLSGYLDMRGGAALGRPGEDAGATLDFGDRPARIFVGNWGQTGTIGCKLVGSAGLVTGGNGTVDLGASADGIAGGVRVAGGTLQVGATDAEGKPVPGRIDGDVHVEAGSRLVLCDTGSIAPKSKLFLNDRGWIPSVAHVRIEEGGKPVVKEILVAGEPLAHGWYGSSESDAQFVDDIHFEGLGKIHAGSFPTMMILK